MAVIKPVNHKSQVKQKTQADLAYPPLVANRVQALYDAIVGSSAQVLNGSATHTSIQAAHDYVASGGNILVLKGTYTENVAISKTVRIEGQGHSSMLNGTLTFNTGSFYGVFSLIRVGGNISMTALSEGNFLERVWLQAGFTLSDVGTGNYKNVIGE